MGQRSSLGQGSSLRVRGRHCGLGVVPCGSEVVSVGQGSTLWARGRPGGPGMWLSVDLATHDQHNTTRVYLKKDVCFYYICSSQTYLHQLRTVSLCILPTPSTDVSSPTHATVYSSCGCITIPEMFHTSCQKCETTATNLCRPERAAPQPQ